MSKPLIAIIGAAVIIGFVYMHFEWFPGHSGPDQASARAQIAGWAEQVSGQGNPDVRVARISVPDDAGVATVEVAFHNFYYELEGSGQRYSGQGRVDFVRVGPMFRPRWVMTKVSLLDRTPPAMLAVATAGQSN